MVVHFFYRSAHTQQLAQLLGALHRALPEGSPAPFALRWHREISLGFVVVPATEAHGLLLSERERSLQDGLLGACFDPAAIGPIEAEETTNRPQSRRPAPSLGRGEPNTCLCGCGLPTASTWCRGHDGATKGWMIRVDAGQARPNDAAFLTRIPAETQAKLRERWRLPPSDSLNLDRQRG